MKQVILVRTDLKMGKGKIAVAAAHASLASFLKAPEDYKKTWLAEGMKKIVLKVRNEQELLDYYNKFRETGLPCELISDAGLTQVPPGTIVSLGCGPVPDEKIDPLIKDLKLL
ncbi:MAG: peptidyl-tRNA hydrolase [Candidatus Micrarchaeota archaeon]|nr:peptidyl-tRNA hydrolase [Candidatus Micrarchaeota archaeon]